MESTKENVSRWDMRKASSKGGLQNDRFSCLALADIVCVHIIEMEVSQSLHLQFHHP
jgi:hypothetical protein